MKPTLWVTAVLLSSMLAPAALGAIQVVTDRNDEEAATGAFQFKTVPPPSRQDAAERGTFTLVEGQPDLNSGDVRTLNDGKVPREGDQPAENFFFRAGSAGGRLQLDLGTNAVLRQINTYSWHPGTRGPQVYRLFASDGSAAAFQAAPKRDTDPAAAGWRLLATVDTRPQEDALGGQYGVSVQDSNGPLGTFRYLLFDIARTEGEDPFGQTFYSEIDVLAAGSTATPLAAEATKRITQGFEADGGKYRFTIDTTLAPDLTGWADRELRPVVQEWYPRLIGLLPSEGFHPRTNVTLRFRDDMGGTPASAGGGFINCNAGWFRDELNREAPGSVVHEMVHVVQSYARGRRSGPDTARLPGWLVEGIPDYIRWYQYEPQTRGAEISPQNAGGAKYDGSYRVTANFLNWVTLQYDPGIVAKLNAAGRAGNYREDLWKEATGKTVQELGEEWKKHLGQRPEPAGKKEPAR